MTAGGFNKTGWHWTRKGWKRNPRRLQSVKLAKGAAQRRAFKRAVIKPAEREKPPTFAAARKLAAEQAQAVSATTLAPKAGKPATAQPRKAWGGKYADLIPATEGPTGRER